MYLKLASNLNLHGNLIWRNSLYYETTEILKFFTFYFTTLNKFSELFVAMPDLVLVRVIFYPSATLLLIYSEI